RIDHGLGPSRRKQSGCRRPLARGDLVRLLKSPHTGLPGNLSQNPARPNTAWGRPADPHQHTVPVPENSEAQDIFAIGADDRAKALGLTAADEGGCGLNGRVGVTPVRTVARCGPISSGSEPAIRTSSPQSTLARTNRPPRPTF